MKKLKYIISLALVCVILFALICCSNDKSIEYCVLEVGNYYDSYGGNHVSEYSMWSPEKLNHHQDSSAPKEYSVVFNGTTYTGEYSYSSVNIPNIYSVHKYDGDKLFFEVNADTGELTDILFAYEPSYSATMTEEECKKIADDIVKEYISVEEYKLTTSVQSIYDNFSYSYNYCREISGYKTSDSVTIVVDGNGKISYFGINSLGAFKDVISMSLDNDKATDAIDNKLITIYENVSKRQKEYEIKNTCLVKLEDGNYAMLYTISNKIEHVEGDMTYLLDEQVQLLLFRNPQITPRL